MDHVVPPVSIMLLSSFNNSEILLRSTILLFLPGTLAMVPAMSTVQKHHVVCLFGAEFQ